MQPELKALIRKRDARLGLILMAVLLGCSLISGYWVYPVLSLPALFRFQLGTLKVTPVFVGAIVAGTFAGCQSVLLVWVSLSCDSLWRRVLTAILAVVVGWSVWAIGVISTLENQAAVQLFELEPVLASPVHSMLILGAWIPMAGWRLVSGRSLSSIWEPAHRRQGLSIAHLVLGTVVVATAFAFMKVSSTWLENPPLVWQIGLWFFGFGFVIALFGLIPATLLLMSPQLPFFVAVGMVVTLYGTATATISWWVWNTVSIEVLAGIGVGMAMLILGNAAMRCFGFRLRPEA